ncbi:unnamed protein product [Leuciscus chuanchicus]
MSSLAVAGIEGMLIANRKVENQVKTYITYNKGRDWRLLQAPATDLAGNPIHCVLPFCSLHLQLQMSENPYLSGSISTKSSAPGVIMATGVKQHRRNKTTQEYQFICEYAALFPYLFRSLYCNSESFPEGDFVAQNFLL